jgi:hypothetical protein
MRAASADIDDSVVASSPTLRWCGWIRSCRLVSKVVLATAQLHRWAASYLGGGSSQKHICEYPGLNYSKAIYETVF